MEFHRKKYQKHDLGSEYEVCQQNQYMLPDRVEGLVIDVGAHIGYFTKECLKRGADEVYSFEPHPLNFMQLSTNFLDDIRVNCRNKAVWRSDGDPTGTVSMAGWDETNEEANTGGGTIAMDRTPSMVVSYVALDKVLSELDQVDLLKIDAEASEFPIIYTSKLLDKVKSMRIEIHPQPLNQKSIVEGTENTGWFMEKYLSKLGFNAKFHEISIGYGFLVAER